MPICRILGLATCHMLFAVFAVASDRNAPTFVDVAPVIHSKCTSCHREGQPGPFSLLTYQEVRDGQSAYYQQRR